MQPGTVVIERSYHMATVKQSVLKKKSSGCHIIKSITTKQHPIGILKENKKEINTKNELFTFI